jgi:murein tripeptide amidase MpaA
MLEAAAKSSHARSLAAVLFLASSSSAALRAEEPPASPTSAPAATAATPAAATPPPARYSSEWVEASLRDYHTRYPQLTRLYRIGTSNEGRPLWALAIGKHQKRRDSRPAVLLNGAHHGLEFMSIDMVMDAIDVLLLRSGAPPGKDVTLRRDPELDRSVRRFLEELIVWCVPVVNPDGAWASLHGMPRTGRKNGRDTDGNGRIDLTDGVDLNRNYPFKWGFLGEVGSSSKPRSYYYRGEAPGSEPETRAMMRLGESEHFAASISYHTGSVAVLAPYTIDNVKDPTQNEAWTVGEYVVAGLPPHPQGKPFSLRRKLYSVDGTDQDYYRATYGTVALLVEGARRDAKDEAERQAVVRAVRPSWLRLFQRFVDGPAISGRIRDAAGHPVAAEVSVLEIKPQEGETWQSRCRDGRFDRFLPAPGRYTVRVTRPGSTEPLLEQTVDVTAGRVNLDLTLPTTLPAVRCPPPPTP